MSLVVKKIILGQILFESETNFVKTFLNKIFNCSFKFRP